MTEIEDIISDPWFEKRIREEECEALEQYRRGTQDAPTLYRPAGYLKAAGDSGDMVFVANEESEDRQGDIIQVAGWELRNFKSNPVLMFSHDYHIAPVGVVPKVWTEGKQLLNTVKFDMDDPLAAFLKGKYERKFMRAESVGFKPLEFEERKVRGESMMPSFTFKRQELLEISLVSIPAHPRALQKAMHGSGRFTIVMPEIPQVAESDGKAITTAENEIATLRKRVEELYELLVTIPKPDPAPEPAPEPEPSPEEISEKDYARLLESMRSIRST